MSTDTAPLGSSPLFAAAATIIIACMFDSEMHDPPLIWQETPHKGAASEHHTSLQPSSAAHISQRKSETSKAESAHDTGHGSQHSLSARPERHISTFSIRYTRCLQHYVQTFTLRVTATAVEGGTLSTKPWFVMRCRLKALTVGCEELRELGLLR